MPKKRLTQKQQNLVDEFLENLGNKNPKSIYQMMLDAGYAESSAREQSVVLSGIEGELDDIVEQLKDARQKAIQKLKDTVDKAEYRDLVNAIDKLTKNIQLLSGGDTERINIKGNTIKIHDFDGGNPERE